MDYQLKLNGEVDYLDALQRLQRVKEEVKPEQEQLELFGDNKEGK
jgi:hypothetical protein